MKPVFTTFLLIVFLLTGGKHVACVQSSLVKNEVCGQTSFEKIQQECAEINQHQILQSDNSGSERQEELIDFVADKDENEDIIKRYSPQTIRFVHVFYAFISNYTGGSTNCYNYITKLSCYTSSCKYIEQRSLRI